MRIKKIEAYANTRLKLRLGRENSRVYQTIMKRDYTQPENL